jgi:UDP-N-acetylglucosamine 2-epimerase (non-hydrolysing)
VTSIVEVVGARPNFMKVAPVHRALVQRVASPTLVHTGQHYDREMSDVFLEDLGLPSPDVELGVGSGSHGRQTAEVMLRLEPVLEDMRPDVLVVVGDVNSTLAGSLTAAKLGIPVAHVEAGLRSYDRTMPEEINRVLTDVVSDLLFAPTPDAVDNLRREGVVEERIHLVGNVMIDTLDRLLPLAESTGILERLGVDGTPFFVSTVHRPSNVDADEPLRHTVAILRDVASLAPTLLVTHPRTAARLQSAGLASEDSPLRILPSLGYVDFLALMSRATGVLTDSGGIQEEAPSLGVPVLVLRDVTERPEAVEAGTARLVGTAADPIVSQASELLTDRAAYEAMAGAPNPYGDGRARVRIADAVEAGD